MDYPDIGKIQNNFIILHDMSSENKHGGSGSVGEELLTNIPELERGLSDEFPNRLMEFFRKVYTLKRNN